MKSEITTGETLILRRNLRLMGYSCPESYEWHNGEALYHGEPIQGRATEAEQIAINATLDAINHQHGRML